MLGQVDIWTNSLGAGGELEITSDFGFTTVSVIASGGTCTLNCNKIANGIASTPITLQDGQSITINSGNNETNIIDYIIINPDGTCTASIIAR